MSADAVGTLFAVLLAVGLLGVTVAWLLPRRHPIRSLAESLALPLAWLVATSAMLGSLYFSEVENFVPCELCWYQRIAMYPLAVLLAIATWRDDREFWRYAVPVAGIGLAISIYHAQLQAFPDQSSTCSVDAPCTAKWIDVFGFAGIPVLAGASFALIIGLLLLGRHHPARGAAAPTADVDRRPAPHLEEIPT